MHVVSQILSLGFSITVVTVIATLGLYSLVFDQQPAAIVIVGIAGVLNWYLWSSARRNPDYTLVPNTRRGPIATIVLVGLGLAAYLAATNFVEHQRVEIIEPPVFRQSVWGEMPFDPEPYHYQSPSAPRLLEMYERQQAAAESNLSLQQAAQVLNIDLSTLPGAGDAAVADDPAATDATSTEP